MESMNTYRLRVEVLRYRVRANVDSLDALKEVLIEKAEHVHRHDQAYRIDVLRERVAQEVSDIQRMETAASYGFAKGTFIVGLANFGIGSALALAYRSEEHPLAIGATLAQTAFEMNRPFGTVVVAVGPGGVPDDVKVVPLSQWAREQHKTESEIVTKLEAGDYRVMTPERFSIVLNKLKSEILKGSLALPAAASSLERHHEGLLGS